MALAGGQAVSAAAFDSARIGAVTLAELSSNEPAILANNPFYFFKSWGLGIKRFFTTNRFQTVLISLSDLDQKGAELKKALEVAPDNHGLFTKSLEAYRMAAADLNYDIGNLRPQDILSGGLSSGQVLALIEKRLLLHLEFSDDLTLTTLAPRDRVGLAVIRNTLAGVFLRLTGQFEGLGGLRNRINFFADSADNEFAGGDFRLFRLAETVNELLSRTEEETGVNQSLSLTSDDLADRMSGQLANKPQLIPNLVLVSGDRLSRLASIDAVNERTTKSGIRSTLSLARSVILEQLANFGGLEMEAAAKAALQEARREEAELMKIIGQFEGGVSGSYLSLLDRVTFNADQAEAFLGDRQFSSAFSQAVMSSIAARVAITDLSFNQINAEAEIKALKISYDVAASRASGQELTENEALLRRQIEGKIIGLSALLSTPQKSGVFGAAIREVKLLLAELAE